MDWDYLIIGGGLVGLATALKLQERKPGARVLLLEKEPSTGAHQSSHNSGVLHCGLYYKPGSLKARLAVQGIKEMVAFCRRHNVQHEICGKLVVATSEVEDKRLSELLARGTANGLIGLRRLDRAALRRIEPNAAGSAAVLVPEEGIVNYRGVCAAMAETFQRQNGQLVTGCRVVGIRETASGWVVSSATNEYTAKFIVNCAGLHSDRVGKMAGEQRAVRIVPFRGDYYRLKRGRGDLVRNLIYPVPDPTFPFLGVHFTRLITGGVECGPNAVLASSREGYTPGAVNIGDLADALTFPGLWRFIHRHRSMALTEFAQSFSRARFCRALQKLVPDVRPEDLEEGGSGVRAQAMTAEGELVQDFSLIRRARAMHVVNAPSPAATASLAIGGFVVDQILN